MAFDALFLSRARRAALLAWFSVDARPMTASEVAREAGLTQRAVALEVQKLVQADLLLVEAVGPALLLRANQAHPMTAALQRLVAAANAEEPEKAGDAAVRESLAAYGAPLLGVPARPVLTREDTLLQALRLARRDGTVMRVLPVFVARQRTQLDWVELRDRARRENLRAELGMVLDLTADAAGLPSLRAETIGLEDHRRKGRRSFFVHTGRIEQKLAKERTPAAVARWGFDMNMTEEAFRSFAERHLG